MALATQLAEVYARMFDKEFAFGDDGQFPVDISTLSDEAIVAQWRYGKRLFNDRWNSSQEKKDKENIADYFADFIEELGVTVGTREGGGGGGRTTNYAKKAERLVLVDIFVDSKEKKDSATKRARKSTAWDDVTRLAILKQAHNDGMDAKAVKELDLPGLIEQYREGVKAEYAEEIANKEASLRAADAKSQVKIPSNIKLGN